MTLLALTIILESQGFESIDADLDKPQVDLGTWGTFPRGVCALSRDPLHFQPEQLKRIFLQD